MASFTREVKDIVKLFYPNNKQEWILISFLFAFYLSFGLVLALDTYLLDYKDKITDFHFSFDSLSFFLMDGEDLVSHPLIRVITRPIAYLSGIIAGFFGYAKIKTILVLLFTVYCVSMSGILVFRFLKKQVELNTVLSILLTVMYASFFTCFILSFTYESFTISVLFLMAMTYFYASSIKNDTKTNFGADLFFTLMAGGITTTNFAKGVACVFFTKGDLKSRVLRMSILSILFLLICFGIYSIFIQNADSQYNNVLGKYSTYSNAAMGISDYLMRIIDTFLIMPILSLDLVVIDHYIEPLKRIIHTFDTNWENDWWRYSFAIVFYGLLLLGVVKNYKNKIVLMLVAIFAVDICIHILLRFGLSEGFFLYGGHWIFIFPLLLGFLYKAINNKYQKLLFGTYIVLAIVLFVGNISAIYKFVNLAIECFPFS